MYMYCGPVHVGMTPTSMTKTKPRPQQLSTKVDNNQASIVRELSLLPPSLSPSSLPLSLLPPSLPPPSLPLEQGWVGSSWLLLPRQRAQYVHVFTFIFNE